jgi:hypothetical protein
VARESTASPRAFFRKSKSNFQVKFQVLEAIQTRCSVLSALSSRLSRSFHSCLRVAITVPRSIFGCYPEAFTANIGLSKPLVSTLKGEGVQYLSLHTNPFTHKDSDKLQCIHTVSVIQYCIWDLYFCNASEQYDSNRSISRQCYSLQYGPSVLHT